MDYGMDFDDQMEDLYEDTEGFEYLENAMQDYDWGFNEDEGFDPYAGCWTGDC